MEREDKKVVFEEKLSERNVLVDFANRTFMRYGASLKPTSSLNGLWSLTSKGEVKISPLYKKKELLLIRGVILQTEEKRNLVLLRSSIQESRFYVVYSLDGGKVSINFRDGTFSLTKQRDSIFRCGCWRIGNEGFVVLDPVIGEDGKRERKSFEIEGVILQNKNERNLILIKKK